MFRSERRERGSNLVELALVMPVLMLLLATVVDLSRVYFTQIALIEAAREGARYGASHATEAGRDVNICAVIQQEAAGQPLVIGEVANIKCARDVTISTSGAPGTPVQIRIVFDLPVLLPRIVGRPTFRITHTASFRIRCEVGTGC